jgi:hypothetical protein
VIDLLTHAALRPFLWAIGIVLGLLLLEFVLNLLGGSTEIGADSDGALDVSEAGGWGPDILPEAAEGSEADQGGILDLLGLRGVPVAVWLALVAGTFAGLGLALQMAIHAATGGGLLGPGLASLLAAPPAVLVTGRLSRALGRILPRETTAAISERSFGRRFGEVTVGTARLGHPAQVRFTDQFGNLQYLMAEPLHPAEEFGEGARVLILRGPDGSVRLARAE